MSCQKFRPWNPRVAPDHFVQLHNDLDIIWTIVTI